MGLPFSLGRPLYEYNRCSFHKIAVGMKKGRLYIETAHTRCRNGHVIQAIDYAQPFFAENNADAQKKRALIRK